MGFVSPLKPADPHSIAGERAALESWLDSYRSELLSKLEGLDEEQAGRRVLPSLTTLHGLVRHLRKVEHVWFVQVIARSDEPAPFGFPEVRDGDFRLDDSTGLTADVDEYLAAVRRSKEILAGVGLDEVRTHRRIGDVDVRWVMLHLIREYAQHNGHADIIRELVDGTTKG